jgi:hypothetical protein
MYDIIGDIHGYCSKLEELLAKMNYEKKNGIWKHPERKVIFVGDYIDRGPEIRETLHLVRNMVEAGAAQAIMGNHEFNALAFTYHHPAGGHIRKHSFKNICQHYETIRQFRDHAKEWEDFVAWFANLPLFLELDGLRIVHACWEDRQIDYLKKLDRPLTKDILLKAHDEDNHKETWSAFEEVLKGKEIKLPDGHFFIDKEGTKRTRCRTKWWLNSEGLTLEDFLFHAPVTVRDLDVPSEDHSEGYDSNGPIVFFGHYWLNPGIPQSQAQNICCLDYSIAKDGMLVAYRWSGEEVIDSKHFEFVR